MTEKDKDTNKDNEKLSHGPEPDETDDLSRRDLVKQGFFAGAGFLVVLDWQQPLIDRVFTPSTSASSSVSAPQGTTPAPTTPAPTTPAPTTPAPTTPAPTTPAPTTPAPTTPAPTTPAPTTPAPTTPAPTTPAPTTPAPTTPQPTVPVPAVPAVGIGALAGALSAAGAYVLGKRKPAPTAAAPTPVPTPITSRQAGRDSQRASAPSPRIAPESTPSRAPGFVLDEIDGELILGIPGSGESLLLNQTAALVWSLCDGKRSQRQIAGQLMEAYPEARDRIDNDVSAALQLLLEGDAISG